MVANGFRVRSAIGLVATLAALAGSACTIAVGGTDPSTATGTTAPSIASPSGSSADSPTRSAASGRLAIVGRDGGLSTSLPDGSDQVVLVEGDSDVKASQPTWSPDGRQIAWVALDQAQGTGAIIVAGARGEDPVTAPTPFVPYYLGWDPTGSRVAFLGSGGDPAVPVELGVLTVGDAEPPQAIAGGSPFFYFAWGPDGDRVVAHAGADRLEEIDLSGRASRSIERPGLFSTPSWSADGRTLVYVARGEAGVQRLMVRTDGGNPRAVAQGEGVYSFLLSPDGTRLAYQLLGPQRDRTDGPTLAIARTPSGGIWVADLSSGKTERATQRPAMTFAWSPDSQRVLALSPVEGEGPPTFAWQVWEGRTTATVDGLHTPTLEYFREYAPFFTQYAQNTTPWSPKGSAFAYASEGPGGAGQVVVQQVGGERVVVGPGIFVTWSP
ncbi:MAG TPA: hypothetical protein VI341_08880 [Actinomycetota bacterium]